MSPHEPESDETDPGNLIIEDLKMKKQRRKIRAVQEWHEAQRAIVLVWSGQKYLEMCQHILNLERTSD